MMKSYLDLIPISAKVHRKQSRMTRVCIILAVFLVTAIFGMAEMEVRSQRIRAVTDSGNWHVMLKNVNNEDAALVAARPDVAASSWYGVLNYRLDEGYRIQSKDVVLCGFDETFLSDIMVGTQIVEGRYPSNDAQILLTENTKTLLGLGVGNTVVIDTPEGVPAFFTIAGFVKDTSMIMSADAIGAFLTTAGFREFYPAAPNATPADYDSVYYVQLSERCNMKKAIANIREQYHLTDENITLNNILLGLYWQSDDSYMLQLYGVAFVLFLLVLTAGILMIASSLNSNIAERTEFFGLMRCIGSSKKQIVRFVRLEALRWCRTAIPLGIGLGVALVWVLCALLRHLSPTYFANLPVLGVSWLSVVFGVMIGILTVLLAAQSPAKRAARVSPLAAVSGNAAYGQGIRKAANTKLYKVDVALGIHHAKRNKKNFALMVGSFSLSIILFLAFSTAVEFMHHAIRPLKPYTPDISIVSPDNSCSVNRDLARLLQDNKSVKRVYGRMFAYNLPVRIGSQEKEINLVSYEENQFNWSKGMLLEGSVTSAQNDPNAILTVHHADNPLQLGDTFEMKDGRRLTVAGILSDSPFSQVNGVETIICSEPLFRELTGETNYTILDVQLTKQATEEDVNAIRRAAGANVIFSDRRSSNDEARGAYYSFALFVYGFLILIALITVFNIINSIAMSVSARIRQYGSMRAIGMSNRQLVRMIAAEAATYAICGSITGCVLGLPTHKFLYENFRLSLKAPEIRAFRRI